MGSALAAVQLGEEIDDVGLLGMRGQWNCRRGTMSEEHI